MGRHRKGASPAEIEQGKQRLRAEREALARCGREAAIEARRQVIAELDARGLSIAEAVAGVAAAAQATNTRTYIGEGDNILYSKEIPDYKTRLSACELALQLHDALPSARHDIEATGGPIEIRIVDTGSDDG